MSRRNAALQYLTPESITSVMAAMSANNLEASTERRRVLDPCCGSGRMLLAVAEQRPHWEFVGQDVDLRCVRMTAINLALRNLYGRVIWGNSLDDDRRLVYRTGFNHRGFVREVSSGEWPAVVQQIAADTETALSSASPPQTTAQPEPAPLAPVVDESPSGQNASAPPRPGRQLRFFQPTAVGCPFAPLFRRNQSRVPRSG